MSQVQIFSVMLIPNHKDLEPTLLTLTDTPEAFVTNYLERRTQFVMTKVEGVLVWEGKNTRSGWSDVDIMEQDYAREKGKPPYRIRCKQITPNALLGLQIETYRDAFHYL